jgi:hypothetical protein
MAKPENQTPQELAQERILEYRKEQRESGSEGSLGYAIDALIDANVDASEIIRQLASASLKEIRRAVEYKVLFAETSALFPRVAKDKPTSTTGADEQGEPELWFDLSRAHEVLEIFRKFIVNLAKIKDYTPQEILMSLEDLINTNIEIFERNVSPKILELLLLDPRKHFNGAQAQKFINETVQDFERDFFVDSALQSAHDRITRLVADEEMIPLASLEGVDRTVTDGIWSIYLNFAMKPEDLEYFLKEIATYIAPKLFAHPEYLKRFPYLEVSESDQDQITFNPQKGTQFIENFIARRALDQ